MLICHSEDSTYFLCVKISQLQDDKEPLPFTEDEDLIETYDNQHLVSILHLLY